MPTQQKTVVLLVLTLIWAGMTACTSAKFAKKGHPGYRESGVASWYGPGFQGRQTANGEIYDMEALTAAHKQLPFGSLVEVRNQRNGHRVRVRINDRGPFVRGRIIDLSRAAARELGMIGTGTAQVTIKVLGHAKSNPATGGYGKTFVQAGSFRSRARAEEHLERVQLVASNASVELSGEWHRVVVRGLSRKFAEELVRELTRGGIEAVLHTK